MNTSFDPDSATPSPRRTFGWRHVAFVAAGVLAILVISVGLIAWYASTANFENKVRQRVIATLEQATGGRVELQSFRWRIMHLEFEAENLTIHGLEAPGETPYAHVDRLLVRAKILSFFRPKVGLNLLLVERPTVHLIVYPDGSTNQPKPKTERAGKPLNDTLFDLAVDRTEIDNGLALVNQRKMPFDLSARDLGVVVRYSAQGDAYIGGLHASDLSAKTGKRPEIHSRLDLQIELQRNSANLTSLRLQTGPSLLEATASVNNFNQPRWNLAGKGTIDVREVDALVPIEGLERGLVDLQFTGQGTQTAFTVNGNAKVRGAGYHIGTVHASDVDLDTALAVTQDELALNGIHVRLRQGGTVDADLKLQHWLSDSATTQIAGGKGTGTGRKAAAEQRAPVQLGTIRAKVKGVTLATVMTIVSPEQYRDLGFDTAASGDASVNWTGSAADLTLQARMTLAPSEPPAAGLVPVTGTLDAKYLNRGGRVEIRTLQVHTPAAQVDVTGALGVYPYTQPSQLQAQVTTGDLSEFDRALRVIGVSANGQIGSKVIPIALHGQASFQGTVSGSLVELAAKGHLTASNFEVVMSGPQAESAERSHAVSMPIAQPSSTPQDAPAVQTIHWDQLQADAEYTPELIAIQQATLTRGKTAVHVSGQLHAHRIFGKQTAFDGQSALIADLRVQEASVPEVLALAGQNVPVTGTLNLQAHAGGEVGNLNGGGHLTIRGGEAYGEPYRSLDADLRFAGREIGVSKLTLLQNGGRLTGNGGYDLTAKSFHFDAQGSGFELAHFQILQNGKLTIAGQLTFDAHGNGTVKSPSVTAKAHLAGLQLGDQAVGDVNADAHSEHGTLFMTLATHLNSAKLDASGQMALSGDYITQARVTVSDLDVDPIVRALKVKGLSGHSSINGEVTMNGPLRQPRKMNGELTVRAFSVTLAGVPLQSDGTLHAKLQDGVLHLDPLHITGQDTNLRAQGTIGVFNDPRDLNMHASGSVNLQLAQSFNPDLISSGRVDFTLSAEGTMQKPDLGGQVQFTNVAVSLEDLPNGLSRINGTLVFDQDRLEVKDLTAMTGGGQLRLGGFITFQQGLYGDLTATGKDIRIRYPQGVSSMADAKLRLQGSQNNLQLSGNVELTRFAISPDLDLASFAASSGTVAPPPDPDAPSNHVRLDVHITSAPELDFQNSFAKLAGNVDLRIRGTVAVPSVLGHITVTDGSATFAGTQYQLQHGDIYFTNPVRIEPVIDLDATAHVEEYDITVGVHGTSTKLNPTFRSEPPLPEQDIFALLALGRTQEEQSIYSQEQQQAGVNSTADALLGGALNATVSSRIQRLFGGGSVKIDPTFVGTLGNSTARITVEQRISRNATLTYATNVNSTAQQLIQGQLDITQNVSVVALRDEAGIFSLVFKVHKRLH
jgi:translocation and assembly module TamB